MNKGIILGTDGFGTIQTGSDCRGIIISGDGFTGTITTGSD